jgi:hypothetical protein
MEQYRALFSDVLTYLNDPARPEKTAFASQEEMEWFRVSSSSKMPLSPPVAIEAVSPVITPRAREELVTPPEDSKYLLMKEALKKVAPAMRLVEENPSVILIASEQDEETLELLKALAKAITAQLGGAKIIPALRFEQEGRWETFFQGSPPRLILASEGFKKLPGLMYFYKKQPEILGRSPLLPLLPASLYKQLPEKAALWKRLCQILKP